MLSNRNILVIAWTTVVIVATAKAGTADEVTDARQLLQKAFDSTKWSQEMHVALNFRATITRDNAQPRIIAGSGEIFESGDRLHTIKQNDAASGAGRLETLVLPKRRLSWVRGSSVHYTESPILIDKAAALDRGMSDIGWFLFGRFPGANYDLTDFSNILDQGQVQPMVADDIVGGLPCRVIEVKNDLWDFHIWVVPSHGNNFAKYTFDSIADPKSKINDSQIIVEDVLHRQLPNGIWVVYGGKMITRTQIGSPQYLKLDIQVKFTEIDIAPDFEKLKAFDLPAIPNGEYVIRSETDEQGNPVKEYEGMKYMWKDGAIVPAYDPKMVERIRQQLKK